MLVYQRVSRWTAHYEPLLSLISDEPSTIVNLILVSFIPFIPSD